MLQRDRQIRTQMHQITDACLFAASFWLALKARSSPDIIELDGHESHSSRMGGQVCMALFRTGLCRAAGAGIAGILSPDGGELRTGLFWPLLRGSAILTVGMVLLMFYFKAPTLRGVPFIFIAISCALVWLKEELLLAAMHSRLAKAQYKRRIILAGSHAETARLHKLLEMQGGDEIEIAAEFNLAESPPQVLIELIHEHSVSGVLVSAKHAQFERVENVIKLCEVEGVEAWLVADFFATQIARASFDELFGHPLIVFRSTPETSWQMLAKLMLDFFGALLLLLLVASWLFPLIAMRHQADFARPGDFPPTTFRAQWRAVFHFQIPHHVEQRRAVEARTGGDE